MTIQEFESEMRRLKAIFGDRAYPQERERILYQIVKSADVKAFQHAVSNWIADAKTPPIGEQFREFARRQMLATAHAIKATDAEPKCHECWDNGMVLLEMKPHLQEPRTERGYPVNCAAMCMCNVGLAKKARLEADGHKDVGSRQYSLLLAQWYDVKNVWTKPNYSYRPVNEIIANMGASIETI